MSHDLLVAQDKKKPGTVSRSHRQCMDGIAVISQQQVLKSQQGVKPTVKLSAMELVQCTAYCAFKCFAHMGL